MFERESFISTEEMGSIFGSFNSNSAGKMKTECFLTNSWFDAKLRNPHQEHYRISSQREEKNQGFSSSK